MWLNSFQLIICQSVVPFIIFAFKWRIVYACRDHGNDVVVAMLVLTGFSSLPASFLMHLVYERTHKMKHLQLVSGMHPVVYWLSNFVWDLIVSCIPIFLSYVIMVSIGVRAYTEGQNSLALLYLLLTYVYVRFLFSWEDNSRKRQLVAGDHW